MKNLLLSMVILGFLVLGCRNSPSSSSDGGPVAISLPETDVDSVQVILDGNYCYRYMIHRDTYDIHLTLSQGQVRGEMNFDKQEDQNTSGSIEGYIKEDVMNLKYRHRIDGTPKVRELSFRIRGNLLISAEGEELTEGDSTFFRDPASVRYEGLVYSRIDCP